MVQPILQTPRLVLKGVLAQAESLGYQVKTGVECEYFSAEPEGAIYPDQGDRQAKPCYDQQVLDAPVRCDSAKSVTACRPLAGDRIRTTMKMPTASLR
jgi:glutamine synthetase